MSLGPYRGCAVVVAALDVVDDNKPSNSCFDGGNEIFANIDPALFIIRIVVLEPNALLLLLDDNDDEAPLPPPPLPPAAEPTLSGIVTAAIGPPLGHPATKVVVVVDNNRTISADALFSPADPELEVAALTL